MTQKANHRTSMPIEAAGLPAKTRNALMEHGLLTLGAAEGAPDSVLNAIPGFGPLRTANLRKRLQAVRARPLRAPEAPSLPSPAPATILNRPVLHELRAIVAGLGEPGGTIVALRLGLGPEGRLSGPALARRLGVSVGVLERLEHRAVFTFRTAPIVQALSLKVAELALSHPGRLAETLASQPWAIGMSQDCLYRMGLYCWSVNLRREGGRGR